MKSPTQHVAIVQPYSLRLSVAGRTLLARLQRWFRLYRQRRDLAQASDAMLKDLGLSRADVMRESERPFWDDPLVK
ncbi:DUF1127 domain-containing protein [Metapseudomonas otitidis]|uniref:DUF1127 domain-containing protein n=1 Tax=Metapseudomonas otitidis TaxID=319939 RepID=UPI0013F5B7D2|nr:DUF1127 domain-containing protein [Pseudomonas otitidis]